MKSIEELVDLWASLRPDGTEPAAYAEIVHLIVAAVRIDAVKWKLDLKTGKWVHPDTGVPREGPERHGCREIAEAGRLHGHVKGAARPKPGDLKPSESLLRSLRVEEERKAKAAADVWVKERVERNMADLASGKTRIDPDWTPGQPTVEVEGDGGRRVFVREDKVPEAARAKRDEAGRFRKAEPAAPEVEVQRVPLPRGKIPLSPEATAAIERAKMEGVVTTGGHGHDPSFLPPCRPPEVTVQHILDGPGIQKPASFD